MSDYLFDKEGTPDPEVEQLETLLAPLAYRGAPPRLPARPPRRAPVRRPSIVVGAAAAVAAALLALVIARPWRPVPPSWAATVRGGSAMRDGKPITGATRLPVGAWLESGESRVRLLVADIGTVELGPGDARAHRGDGRRAARAAHRARLAGGDDRGAAAPLRGRRRRARW